MNNLFTFNYDTWERTPGRNWTDGHGHFWEETPRTVLNPSGLYSIIFYTVAEFDPGSNGSVVNGVEYEGLFLHEGPRPERPSLGCDCSDEAILERRIAVEDFQP